MNHNETYRSLVYDNEYATLPWTIAVIVSVMMIFTIYSPVYLHKVMHPVHSRMYSNGKVYICFFFILYVLYKN